MDIRELPYSDYASIDMETLSPEQQETFIQYLFLHARKSKVVEAYCENFLSVMNGSVTFDDNMNIVALVGYNDSGKTATSRIFDIIFYDLHQNTQASMIYDVENGYRATFFKVGVRFSDGVRVEKIKRVTGESTWVLYHNDFIIYTNDKDTAHISTDGVPQMISSYLCVSDVQKEKINIRRNTDKLFLVHTNSGDNTKIIYTLLSLDNVTEVQQELNKEKNSLQTQVSQRNFAKRSYIDTVNRIKVMDVKEEKILEGLTEKLQNQVERTTLINALYEERKKLSSITSVPEIELVDMDRFKLLHQIFDIRKALPEKPLEQLELVDITRYKELKAIVQLRANLDIDVPPSISNEYLLDSQIERVRLLKDIQEKRAILDTVDVKPSIEAVSLDKITFLKNMLEVKRQLDESKRHLDEVNRQKAELETLGKQLVDKYGLKVCSNCGELSVMQEVG